MKNNHKYERLENNKMQREFTNLLELGKLQA
jgi:hypothetical protein